MSLAGIRRQSQRWLRAIVPAILAACLPSVAAAFCGGGFASEDLTVACLTRQFETADDEASRAAAAGLLISRLVARGHSSALGFGEGPGWTHVGRTAEPVLRYDENVNGGSPEGPLVLDGLAFEIPEDQVRQPDLVLGGRVTVAARRILGKDTWIDLQGGAMLAYAATEHVALKDVSLDACLRRGTGPRSSLRACASGAYRGRKLQDDRAAILSVEHIRTGVIASRPVLVSFGIRRRFLEDYSENGLLAGAEAIVAPDLVIGLAGAINAPVAGENVERRSLTVFAAGQVGRMKGRVYLRHGESSGSNVLGIDRRDETQMIGLTTVLPRGLLLDVSYRRRRGTIAYFDEAEPHIGIRFAGYRF